jgi:hypothetical protein
VGCGRRNWGTEDLTTHALIDSARPELSAIVLSQADEQGMPVEGFLRAHDIYNLRLAAELVVVSHRGRQPPTGTGTACQICSQYLEIVVLRHELAILRRQTGRLVMTTVDRLLLATASWLPSRKR